MKHLWTLAAAAVTAGALAQSPVARKPGLWEVQTTQAGAAMPDMGEMLAKMPPAQRAQMEKMMKERGVATGGAPGSFRYCLTPERAAKDLMAPQDGESKCEHKVVNQSATEVKFSFSCTGKDGRATRGEGRAYDLTPDRYAMDMTMNSTADGKPMQMRMAQKGKWLGADCKGLKPLPN